MPIIRFHAQDAETQPIAHAFLSGESPEHGHWQAVTDASGDFKTPTPGLAPGSYVGTVSAEGYVTRTFQWTFGADGTVVVGLDLQHGPTPPPIPPIATDMIDLSKAVIVNAPDVRAWTITAAMQSVAITPANTVLAFTKHFGANYWPDVTPPGWTGPVQYTVWLFLRLNGVWTGSGFIQCWQDRDGCGDAPSDYVVNWYYPNAWYPMSGQPIAPGDTIGYMVTAGSARAGSEAFSVAERSNVVLLTVPVGENGTVRF